MDLLSVCVVAAVLAAACLMVWLLSSVVRAQVSSNREIIESLITYRTVHSPDARAIELLTGLCTSSQERLLVFSEEGREILKEREQTRTIIEGLRGEITIKDRVLSNMGVTPRPQDVPPPPPRAPLDIIEANFVDET